MDATFATKIVSYPILYHYILWCHSNPQYLTSSLLQNSFSGPKVKLKSGQCVHILPENRILFFTPDSLIIAVTTLPTVAVFIAFATALEYGVHKNSILQSDSPAQFGQWGPWVAACLVLVGTIVVRSTNHDDRENLEGMGIPPTGIELEQLQIQNFEDLQDQLRQGARAYERFRGRVMWKITK